LKKYKIKWKNVIILVFFTIGLISFIKWGFFGTKKETKNFKCDGGYLIMACFKK
jgi:hypothetical protein